MYKNPQQVVISILMNLKYEVCVATLIRLINAYWE